MTAIINVPPSPLAPTVTPETILVALQALPPEFLPEVLQFIQFLEWKLLTISPDESSPDEVLWNTEQANLVYWETVQAYQEQSPEEELEQYSSGAEFMKAVRSL